MRLRKCCCLKATTVITFIFITYILYFHHLYKITYIFAFFSSHLSWLFSFSQEENRMCMILYPALPTSQL